MVNAKNATKIVSPQAGHLAPLQGWFLFGHNAHNLGRRLYTDHVHLQADANWMFGVEIELETCDNV